MIAWGYYLTYPGETKPYTLRVYPGDSEGDVTHYARSATSGTLYKAKVVRVEIRKIARKHRR